MSNIVQSPPFLFTYWNPLAKDSNLVGSWFDYVKDVSLAKYTADSMGRYVQQASADQISAINSTGQKICGALSSGFSGLQKQLERVTGELQGVNQRLDMVLDEARTSNLLQENMAELLRIPDSQKQRQHHIEMALKFLKNALKDEDLYQDALSELLEAEKLMPSDYFILHRIGMIFLYVPALGNLEKALDYFARAGKYALVESHPDAARLSNILNKKVTKHFAKQPDASSADLSILAAESYFQGATTLYALSRFDEAAKLAEKAVKCQPNEAKYHFYYAKYLARSGNPEAAVAQLEKATELVPAMALAVIGDYDLNHASLILDLLNRLDDDVSTELRRGLDVLKDWPHDDHRYTEVQQWVTDAQGSLEKGAYPQKRLLAEKLKEHEGNLSFAPKLAKIAAFGVEFDRIQAQKLLIGNNPDHVRKLWDQRRKRNSILNARLRQIAAKSQPDFLELVLLATAVNSSFFAAGTIRWNAATDAYGIGIAVGNDGTVYIGSANKVQALNGRNGNTLWEFEIEGYNNWAAPAIGSDGTVYVTSESHLFALDGDSGKEHWKVKANVCNYPAIGNDKTVYVNSGLKVFAFDGQTGKQLWEFKTGDDPLDSSKSSPAIGVDGTIYIAASAEVFALNGQTGKELWAFEIEKGNNISSPAIGADGTVYVGSAAKNIYALDGRTGKTLWGFQTRVDCNTSPIVGQNGTVYVETEGLALFALHGQTGEQLWKFTTAGDILCNSYPIVGDDGTVYVGALNEICALDGQTGEKLWEFKPKGDASQLIMGADGTIYFQAGKKIYAISTTSGGLAGSPWPMHGRNAQRTGCAATRRDNPAVSKEQKSEIKCLMAEAEAAEKTENAKWLKKKDFTRARELYAQAAKLGSKEATTALKRLDT